MLPPAASAFTICIGILVLIGWSLDLEPLKRVLPGFVAMNPGTAVLFILIGIALASALRSRSLVTGVMGKVLSAIVVVAAASELLEFAGICRSPVDEVLFAAKLSATQDGLPNRMAPNTALNFFLAGLSILLLDTRGRRSLGQALAILIGLGAILSITGYGYGVRSFSGLAPVNPVALHTAVTFFILAAGIFFAVPRAPLAEPFATNDPRERLARILRILFPLAVLLTLFLGWLCVWGERHQLYESAFGTALYAITLIFLFAVFVRWAVSVVGKLEAEHAVANARLREVNRRKDEMIAVVSHDLCSPLTGFQMVIDLLRTKSEEPTEELLGLMDHSARRMVSMVRGLLDISKLQTENIELELGDVLASEVIRQSMEPLAINANAKRITLRLHVAPGEPTLRADRLRVSQIFDKYRQTTTKATAGEGGTGLGLAIVRELVLLHAGQITVTSEVNRGSVFTVRLPVNPERQDRTSS